MNQVTAGEKRYDTMKKTPLEIATIFNRENESRKLLEFYRRLSYQFDDRTA